MKTINNNIEETHVLFDVALLLQEKEFGVPVRYYYLKQDTEKYLHEGFEDDYWGDNRIVNWNKEPIGIKPFRGFVSAPTQQLAIDWIRINFDIHIHFYFLSEKPKWGWDCYRYIKDNGLLNNTGYSWVMNHQTLEEAKEAALLYVLQNLIPND